MTGGFFQGVFLWLDFFRGDFVRGILSWNRTGGMSLFNWEINQRGQVSRVADTELVLLIA